MIRGGERILSYEWITGADVGDVKTLIAVLFILLSVQCNQWLYEYNEVQLDL